MLNPVKRTDEEPLGSIDNSEAFEKALFYMYGGLESLEGAESQHLVHNLLRRYKIWNGTSQDAQKYLDK